MSRQASGLPVLLGVIAIALLLVGFRHFIWGPQASVGELLPFPARATGMLRAYFSSWEQVGLGQPGPSSPAYFLLGIFPLVTLGAAGAAQKLLILTLALVALWGAYRLMADLVDRPARWAAGATYVLSTTGYVAFREGSLGALVFASAAPFALHSLLRFTGWVRPAAWSAGREAAVLAVAGAVSAAFVPGSLFIYLLALVLLTIGRAAARTAFLNHEERASGAGGSCRVLDSPVALEPHLVLSGWPPRTIDRRRHVAFLRLRVPR